MCKTIETEKLKRKGRLRSMERATAYFMLIRVKVSPPDSRLLQLTMSCMAVVKSKGYWYG